MLKKIQVRILRAWWKNWIPRQVALAGVELGRNVEFYGRPIIEKFQNSRISIGRECVICSMPEYTALGVSHRAIIRTLREGAVLDIGADTGISGASICAAVSVKIGQKVLIGANVTIADTDFHAINPAGRRHNKNHDEIASRPVLIGDNVFIGAGSYILKGVTIGENSIIGANSVVAKSIPANVIAAGNPAKIVKEIRD